MSPFFQIANFLAAPISVGCVILCLIVVKLTDVGADHDKSIAVIVLGLLLSLLIAIFGLFCRTERSSQLAKVVLIGLIGAYSVALCVIAICAALIVSGFWLLKDAQFPSPN